MVIDPLEAVIVWMRNNWRSAQGRVASKHRYGSAWQENQIGVSVHLDGGPVDLYAQIATPRIEVRIYAPEQREITNAWMEMVALSRENERFEVMTSRGRALVHTIKPETTLSLIYDDVLKKDLGIVFLSCMVAEQAVTI